MTWGVRGRRQRTGNHDDNQRSFEPELSWAQNLAQLAKLPLDSLAIVGIGHPLKGDDYVGSIVAKELAKTAMTSDKFAIINAENSPENALHLLHKSPPSLVIIVDSLEAGQAPGSVVLADLSQTTYPYFATHNIPMKILFGTLPGIRRIILLGIQPKSHEFGEPLSSEVDRACRLVVGELRSLMTSLKGGRNGG